MTKEDLINKIWDCYIDIQNSCGMITDEEAMQKSVKLLDEYELSKFHQPTVIKNEVTVCDKCLGRGSIIIYDTCLDCEKCKGSGTQTVL